MRERERTQCAQLLLPPPLFRRLILFLSFFFFLFYTLSFSLYMYTYVFTIRRRCRRKEEKDELLAHIQARKSAHFASTSPSKKQLQFAQKKEKELFSLFAYICICVHIYMCNDVIVTSMPCLLLLFASEQINVVHYFFLSLYIYIVYVQKKK